MVLEFGCVEVVPAAVVVRGATRTGWEGTLLFFCAEGRRFQVVWP